MRLHLGFDPGAFIMRRSIQKICRLTAYGAGCGGNPCLIRKGNYGSYKY